MDLNNVLNTYREFKEERELALIRKYKLDFDFESLRYVMQINRDFSIIENIMRRKIYSYLQDQEKGIRRG